LVPAPVVLFGGGQQRFGLAARRFGSLWFNVAPMECSRRSKKLVWPIADVCNGRPCRVMPMRLIHGSQLVDADPVAGQLGTRRDRDRRFIDCA
jgi:hypothetical protein